MEMKEDKITADFFLLFFGLKIEEQTCWLMAVIPFKADLVVT